MGYRKLLIPLASLAFLLSSCNTKPVDYDLDYMPDVNVYGYIGITGTTKYSFVFTIKYSENHFYNYFLMYEGFTYKCFEMCNDDSKDISIESVVDKDRNNKGYQIENGKYIKFNTPIYEELIITCKCKTSQSYYIIAADVIPEWIIL